MEKLNINHIEVSVRARKAVGASKVRVVMLKQRKVMWVGEFHVLSMPQYTNSLRKDGTLAAYLRRPIQKALDDGADDFQVTIV